jgi:hypothetical protein
MHDDVIITKHDWLQEVKTKFYGDPNVIIAYTPHLMCCQCDSATHQELPLLRFPHLLCAFLVCRKKWIRKLGSNWCGYHIATPPFMLEEKVGDVEKFYRYYRKLNLLDSPPEKDKLYNFISMEMGAWHFYNACQQGFKFVPLDKQLIIHFGAMSWEVDTGKSLRLKKYTPVIKALEKEIYNHPDYGPLYDKYLPACYK